MPTKVLKLRVKTKGQEGRESYEILRYFADNIKILGQMNAHIDIKKAKKGLTVRDNEGQVRNFPILIVNKGKVKYGLEEIREYVDENIRKAKGAANGGQRGGGRGPGKGYVPYGAMAFGEPSLDNFYSSLMTPEQKKRDDTDEGLGAEERIDENKMKTIVQRESAKRGINGASDGLQVGGRGPHGQYADKASMASQMDDDGGQGGADEDNIGDPMNIAVARRGISSADPSVYAEDDMDRALLEKAGWH